MFPYFLYLAYFLCASPPTDSSWLHFPFFGATLHTPTSPVVAMLPHFLATKPSPSPHFLLSPYLRVYSLSLCPQNNDPCTSSSPPTPPHPYAARFLRSLSTLSPFLPFLISSPFLLSFSPPPPFLPSSSPPRVRLRSSHVGKVGASQFR